MAQAQEAASESTAAARPPISDGFQGVRSRLMA
jgi:hypothetical protein